MTVVQAEQSRVITVTLRFEAIDTDECVLDCDGGCSNQAAWIAFTKPSDPHHPAFALCDGCLVKLEQYAGKQAGTSPALIYHPE